MKTASHAHGPVVRTILTLLRHAHDQAESLQRHPLDLVPPFAVLRALGIGPENIAALCSTGLVKQYEVRRPRKSRARPRYVKSDSLTDRSRLLLTPRGLAAARELLACRTQRFSDPSQRPRWEAERRRLWFGDILVKSFPRAANCQELILASFEEESWPTRIDSPLPGHAADTHECLRNAVKKLNRQQNPLLRFRLDGSGKGVTWETLA